MDSEALVCLYEVKSLSKYNSISTPHRALHWLERTNEFNNNDYFCIPGMSVVSQLDPDFEHNNFHVHQSTRSETD